MLRLSILQSAEGLLSDRDLVYLQRTVTSMHSQSANFAAYRYETHLPFIAVHRGRSMYKGISLGKASTGRIVDWKPPGKDMPAQPAGGSSQAPSASKEAKPPDVAHTPSMTLMLPDCYEITRVTV